MRSRSEGERARVKILTLLRHAKSDWDDPRQRDFDRPLNRRGRAAAFAMGRAMRDEGMRFDAIYASPAVRVTETLAIAGEGYGEPFAPEFDQQLYLASPILLLERVQYAVGAGDSILLAGHNPGMEQLALMLSGTGDADALAALAEKYPTGTLAAIRFDVGDWADIREGSGTLTRFLRPRDLDPDLGPGN